MKNRKKKVAHNARFKCGNMVLSQSDGEKDRGKKGIMVAVIVLFLCVQKDKHRFFERV